ncbi:MAG: sugar phosphate nucleotidyltransferase [Rickettsia endosymbiont of Ixodes persulcatus]|nr:sugar phosphate nucleotidyltransferase [Rickettsia endosymbiont of Ixodes persulcatus]MCZ6913818.1 sugar phosphate nucleotidyltransferase [Rickettsia endosymbiont of Ixodes persulcatus]
MKTIILVGGFGTRLSEETANKPKPVDIGGRPILWNIMKIYAYYGFQEFIIALGYKADVIKKYFLKYAHLSGNLTVEIKCGESRIVKREPSEWVIHLEETGLETCTGGRMRKLSQ